MDKLWQLINGGAHIYVCGFVRGSMGLWVFVKGVIRFYGAHIYVCGFVRDSMGLWVFVRGFVGVYEAPIYVCGVVRVLWGSHLRVRVCTEFYGVIEVYKASIGL